MPHRTHKKAASLPFSHTITLALLLLLAIHTVPVASAPGVPDADSRVLEHLPSRASAPLARELRELRAAQARDPENVDTAVRLARRYFDLASAEGDPRYVGYAEAVIQPLSKRATPDASVLLIRALLRQYRHEFAPALADLDSVLKLEPQNTEAMLWQFALHLVQADYERAKASCANAAPHATRLSATACMAVIDSINGKSRDAYASLSAAMARHPTQDIEYRQWAMTRQGEMALRLGDRKLAEKHFKEAIATGYTDGFVLAAYADLLLEDKRHAEVIALLKRWVASDILLLRLAIAEDAAGMPEAANHRKALAERFAAAALRGDKLHQQEEARFELELQHDAARALVHAADNWKRQREPRDALVLMQAALAAGKPEAARPALDWMSRTGYEEPRYRAFAKPLGGTPDGAAEKSVR